MKTETKSVNALLNDRVTEKLKESSEMLADDMWRDGKGFIGEIGVPQSSRYFTSVKEQVKNGLITQNVLAEICDRKSAGVLGRDPVWGFLPESHAEPTEAEVKLIEEAEAALTKWWNENEILQKMRDSLEIAFPEQRAEIRPFVPSAYLDADGNIEETSSLTEALEKLKFDVHPASVAGVFRDPKTFKPFSIFKTLRDGVSSVDISYTDGDGRTHFRSFAKEEDANRFLSDNFAVKQMRRETDAEDSVEYLKNNFSSIAAYLDESNKPAAQTEPEPIDLKGKLHLFELDLRKPFISESIKSKQKEINLAFTMKGRNINLAGSRERYFSNTRPPTRKKRVPDENAPGGFREVKEAAPMYVGAGQATFLQGAFIRDENGKITGVANPNISITDPVTVKNFLDTIYSAYSAILAEAQQLHVLLNESAAASGKSRREARAEFEKSLKFLKTQIDTLGRWILEYALSFAAALCGRTADFADLRCNFDSIVDAGMPDPEERAANIADYKEGVISLQTLRSRNGVEDPDAERARIESEPAYEINLLKKILEVLQMANGKISVENQNRMLGKALGWKDEEIAGNLAELAEEDPIIAGVLENRKNKKEEDLTE